MNLGNAFERCLTFINCQINPPPTHSYIPNGERRMSVTLSRQTGSGAAIIGQHLTEYLQAKTSPGGRPWTVFDRDLMEKVLEDHHLPKRLAEFVPEDRISAAKDMMEELLGLHPASSTLVYQTGETMLRLAELGHVILIGRGGNVVLARQPNVVHVRLVGSLESRVARARELYGMQQQEALSFIRRTDIGRARWMRKYFQKEIEDPLLYDLMINTDRFSIPEVVQAIGELVLNRSRLPFPRAQVEQPSTSSDAEE